MADVPHPQTHVLLRLSHQVKGALPDPDVGHKTLWQILPVEAHARIHLLTVAQADDAQWLLVVFQKPWVTALLAAPQDKPVLPPGPCPAAEVGRQAAGTSHCRAVFRAAILPLQSVPSENA